MMRHLLRLHLLFICFYLCNGVPAPLTSELSVRLTTLRYRGFPVVDGDSAKTIHKGTTNYYTTNPYTEISEAQVNEITGHMERDYQKILTIQPDFNSDTSYSSSRNSLGMYERIPQNWVCGSSPTISQQRDLSEVNRDIKKYHIEIVGRGDLYVDGQPLRTLNGQVIKCNALSQSLSTDGSIWADGGGTGTLLIERILQVGWLSYLDSVASVVTRYLDGQRETPTRILVRAIEEHIEGVRDISTNTTIDMFKDAGDIFWLACAMDSVDILKMTNQLSNAIMSGHTLLNTAIYYGSNQVVKYLIEEESMALDPKPGIELFLSATINGSLDILKMLLRYRPVHFDYLYDTRSHPHLIRVPDGYPASAHLGEVLLFAAVENGHLETLKHLLTFDDIVSPNQQCNLSMASVTNARQKSAEKLVFLHHLLQDHRCNPTLFLANIHLMSFVLDHPSQVAIISPLLANTSTEITIIFDHVKEHSKQKLLSFLFGFYDRTNRMWMEVLEYKQSPDPDALEKMLPVSLDIISGLVPSDQIHAFKQVKKQKILESLPKSITSNEQRLPSLTAKINILLEHGLPIMDVILVVKQTIKLGNLRKGGLSNGQIPGEVEDLIAYQMAHR